MSNPIHIVALDVPLPLNYGGAIDMFYRIKALHALGFKITLHCFNYGRGEQKELEEYAYEVIYYSRKKSVLNWFSSTPFIVKSRANKTLLSQLCLDTSPILFEGIHTTAFLNNDQLKGRIKLVRCHNIEHDYYNALAKRARGLKSIFYTSEAEKLVTYESQLSQATALLVIQQNDLEHFKQLNVNTHLLPASLPENQFNTDVSVKDYVLFHGNLSVSENEEAAEWLVQQVCSKLTGVAIKFAGKSPSETLKNRCAQYNIDLISSPSSEEMNRLIAEAKVHLFYTNQTTGLKLKLLSALQCNGITIVNSAMVEGTGLGSYCQIANTPGEYVQCVNESFAKAIDLNQVLTRKTQLLEAYNTVKNCGLIELLCQQDSYNTTK